MFITKKEKVTIDIFYNKNIRQYNTSSVTKQLHFTKTHTPRKTKWYLLGKKRKETVDIFFNINSK